MEEIMVTSAEDEKMTLKEVRQMPGDILPLVVKVIHSLNVGGR